MTELIDRPLEERDWEFWSRMRLGHQEFYKIEVENRISGITLSHLLDESQPL